MRLTPALTLARLKELVAQVDVLGEDAYAAGLAGELGLELETAPAGAKETKTA